MIFHLQYKDKTIGVLTCDGRWEFKYTEELQKLGLAPITQFPLIEKTYIAEKLWPFFSLRIPSLRQPVISEIIEKEGIDPCDEAALLARFGKRTIKDPFILKPYQKP